MSTMQDPDGSDGLGLELGEEDLLFPGHRNVSIQPVTPAVDRLDPSVPHSEEFDYTFQEMMQATADAEFDASGSISFSVTNMTHSYRFRSLKLGNHVLWLRHRIDTCAVSPSL